MKNIDIARLRGYILRHFYFKIKRNNKRQKPFPLIELQTHRSRCHCELAV